MSRNRNILRSYRRRKLSFDLSALKKLAYEGSSSKRNRDLLRLYAVITSYGCFLCLNIFY
jgi:hypothetical protein